MGNIMNELLDPLNPQKICLRSIKEFHARPGTLTIGPCCKIWMPANNRAEYENLVQDLQTGKQNPLCSQCLNSEKNGEISWRIIGNKSYVSADAPVRAVEIGLSNVCDCACIYCDPSVSSKFEQEYNSPKNTIKIRQSAFIKIIPETSKDDVYQMAFDHLNKLSDEALTNKFHTYVNLIGGEPLLDKFAITGGISRIVERFYHNNNTNRLTIIITTNCNTPTVIFNKMYAEITLLHSKWPTFDVEVGISNESVGLTSEYIRYGLSYDTFIENVIKWLKIDWVKIRFSSTVSPYSVKDTKEFLKQMVELCSSYGRSPHFGINKVYFPEDMNITLLDDSFKHYITDAIEYLREHTMMVNNSEDSIERLEQIRDEIGTNCNMKHVMIPMLDYVKLNRGLDLRDINPELFNYIYD